MLERYKISPCSTVKDAIEMLDKNQGKVVFVVDESDHLLGLFTQGDMRSFILKSNDLGSSIESAMNPKPIVFHSMDDARKSRKEQTRIVYPIVNKEGVLTNALFDRQLVDEETYSDALHDVPLVIMAGGKGTRLYPYTKVLPKALIPIGDFTISERIINSFVNYGCKQVHFILNHKANMIKAYYNDLEKSYHVDYAIEDAFQGTAGGLTLLKDQIDHTFILSNCDIIINDDLECIYRTHKLKKNKITFVCAMKNITIPYGVVKTDEYGNIIQMDEKPEISFLTNTGVYVIEPEVISEIKENEFVHLPDLAKRLMDQGEKVGVFPISEQAWMDMGQFNEMESMIQRIDGK